jgi:hypothetical protein
MDFISRYASAISLIAVAALSVFNIGYFWKIGLHFIGLVDLTNLVYSVGLAVIPIAAVLFGALWVIPKKPTPAKIIAMGVFGVAISSVGLFYWSPRTLEPQLIENGAVLFGLVISGTASLIWMLERQKQTGLWEWQNSAVLLFCLFGATWQAGSFTAAVELADRFTYTVATKAGVLPGVRILRSSSSGFILATAPSRLMFIPQSEIKSVTSE